MRELRNMSDAEILGPNEQGPRNAKDASFSDSAQQQGPGARPSGQTFPWERLIFTVIFAFIAWFTFWLALGLGLLAGGLRLFGVKTDANIGQYTKQATDYLGNVLAYVAGDKADKPFPFG
jgi:hypothetical protein